MTYVVKGYLDLNSVTLADKKLRSALSDYMKPAHYYVRCDLAYDRVFVENEITAAYVASLLPKTERVWSVAEVTEAEERDLRWRLPKERFPWERFQTEKVFKRLKAA